MIGARPGVGRVALNGVKAIERRRLALQPAARCERARIPNARRSGAEEVGVERQDHVGLVDRILRVDVLAKRELAARSGIVTAGRIPLNPLRLRILRQKTAYLRGQGRRRNRFRQNPDAGALTGFLHLERILECGRERAEGTDVAEIGDVARPVRIVEAENRGLREQIRRAAARWMIGVAFDLRRAALMAFDEQPDAGAVHRHRGREEQRFARDFFLGLAHVGHDLLGRRRRR